MKERRRKMRHRRIRDIVIELTSLLDVVMILIFGVMIQNNKLVEEANAKVNEIQEENSILSNKLSEMDEISEELAAALAKLDEQDMESLLEQLNSANNQLEAYKYMDDFVIVYNVGLENKYNNTTKILAFGQANSDEQHSESIKKSDDIGWNTAVNSLKVDINNFISENKAGAEVEKYIYIVFSVNPNKVYEKDYQEIYKILANIEEKNGSNVVRFIPKEIEED